MILAGDGGVCNVASTGVEGYTKGNLVDQIKAIVQGRERRSAPGRLNRHQARDSEPEGTAERRTVGPRGGTSRAPPTIPRRTGWAPKLSGSAQSGPKGCPRTRPVGTADARPDRPGRRAGDAGGSGGGQCEGAGPAGNGRRIGNRGTRRLWMFVYLSVFPC